MWQLRLVGHIVGSFQFGWAHFYRNVAYFSAGIGLARSQRAEISRSGQGIFNCTWAYLYRIVRDWSIYATHLVKLSSFAAMY